jgi:hypothetical protein
VFFFCLETIRQAQDRLQKQKFKNNDSSTLATTSLFFIPHSFQTVYKDSIISIKIEMQNLSIFSFVLKPFDKLRTGSRNKNSRKGHRLTHKLTRPPLPFLAHAPIQLKFSNLRCSYARYRTSQKFHGSKR